MIENYMEQKVLHLKITEDIPSSDFTGKVIWEDNVVSHFVNGKLHREDGPAVVRPNQNDFYLEGIFYYTEEMYFEELKNRQKSS